jgi:hypothetical protein
MQRNLLTESEQTPDSNQRLTEPKADYLVAQIGVVMALGAGGLWVAASPLLRANVGDWCAFLALGHASGSVFGWPVLCGDRAGCCLAGRFGVSPVAAGQDQGMSMVV